MTKYKICQIIGGEQEYFYCKQKFGPFWVTPFCGDLRYDTLYNGMGKNPMCRRFKTKEELLKTIEKVRENDLAREKYWEDQKKNQHIELGEV